jgi:hypothetical protein
MPSEFRIPISTALNLTKVRIGVLSPDTETTYAALARHDMLDLP